MTYDPTDTPSSRIERRLSGDVPDAVLDQAMELADAHPMNGTGAKPASIAAAAHYAAEQLAKDPWATTDRPSTQSEIGDLWGVSEPTLRKRFRDLGGVADLDGVPADHEVDA